MKQVEYTEKQKIVLEVLNEFEKRFYKDYNDFDFRMRKWHSGIEEIKKKYGITEKYLTLREYLNKHACGAYHDFHFKIDGNISVKVCGASDFERIYNPKILDGYYVVKDETESFGSNCENYSCRHHLTLTPKDD